MDVRDSMALFVLVGVIPSVLNLHPHRHPPFFSPTHVELGGFQGLTLRTLQGSHKPLRVLFEAILTVKRSIFDLLVIEYDPKIECSAKVAEWDLPRFYRTTNQRDSRQASAPIEKQGGVLHFREWLK